MGKKLTIIFSLLTILYLIITIPIKMRNMHNSLEGYKASKQASEECHQKYLESLKKHKQLESALNATNSLRPNQTISPAPK